MKPTMSHAVNKEQLNELLVKYYEEENAKLKEMESMFDLCVKCLYSSSGNFTKPVARKIHIYLAKNDMEHKKF